MGEKVLGPATATIIIDNSIHFLMHSIFLTGTAGAGKSLLTSVITAGYADRGSDAIAVNLDPGARSLPYSPDVDVRSFIDLNEIMDKYQLGPNGSLIFASDLVATRIVEIEEEIASLSPDYAFFDTPGQIELFAYRSSGPYIVESIRSETKLNLFLFDATLVSSPTNLVSIALLSASIRLRLKIGQVSVLSKRDMLGDGWRKIMSWSSRGSTLEEAMGKEVDQETYLLGKAILSNLASLGLSQELFPVSATTEEGILELSAMISRVLRGGEEIN